MRFYADGRVVEWPAPKGWHEFRSHYSIVDGDLVVAGVGRMRLQLRGDRMVLGSGPDATVYRRANSAPEPGRLENNQPAVYLKNPI